MVLVKKYRQIIFLLILFVLAIFVRLPGFNEPLIDAYYFRQAHTATVARNFYQDGINLMRPRLDWFGVGREQYLIQEFPVYQAVVAGLSFIFGYSTQLARIVSILAGIASGICLYFIVYLVSRDKLKSLFSLIFFWFSPLAIFVHHAVMSESLVLFLHLLSIVLWLLYLKSEKTPLLFIFIPLTIVATIGKITYGPFLLLFILLLGLIYKGKKYYLKPKIVFCFLLITMATIYWQNTADSANIAAGQAFFSSKNPENLVWNMGYLSERFVLSTWQIRFQEILGSVTKISALMGLIGVLALLWCKNKERAVFLGWFVIMTTYYLVFFRMQNHIYYFHIVIPIVAVLAAYGLEACFEMIRRYSKRSAYFFLIFFISFFIYKSDQNARGYFVLHRDVERKIGILNQYLKAPGPMVLVFPVWDWHAVYTYYTGRKAIIISFAEIGNLDTYSKQGYSYVIFQDFGPGFIDSDLLKKNKLKLIHEDQGILIAQF